MDEAPLPIEHDPSEQSIRTETLADGMRFVLPARRGRMMRIAGACMMGFSLFFIGFAAVWITQSLGFGSGAANTPAAITIFSYVFAAVGLVPLFTGLGIFITGLGLLVGWSRCEIEITGNQLRVIERVGPLRKAFKRSRSSIARLAIELSTSKRQGEAAGPTVFGPQYAVVARAKSGRPLLLGAGYPLAVLRDLAVALRDELELSDEAVTLDIATPRSRSGLARVGDADDDEQPVDPPANTNITIDEHGDELNIFVPASGVWKGSKGMFVFSLVWLGFITVFSVIWIPAWWSQGGSDRLVALFVVPFWLIGIAILIAAINMGRRKAYIDVVAGTLLISRKGIFGIKQREFDLADVTDIHMGPSGMEVNDVPVMELQIITASEGKYGLLSQRDNDELRWLADALRRFAARTSRGP